MDVIEVKDLVDIIIAMEVKDTMDAMGVMEVMNGMDVERCVIGRA